MATTITKNFRIVGDNAKTYAYDSRDMNVFNRDDCFVGIYLNNYSNDTIYLNQEGKNLLFPTATAKPYQLVNSMRYRRTIGGTAYFTFYIDGTSLHSTSTSSKEYTTDTVTLTSSAVTNCTSSSEFKWYISINATTRGAWLLWNEFTMYFYQYACSATAGTGIKSASVSNTAPYSGETTTFTCTVDPAYVFDGWYSGSTLVSTSQTYTANAADLALTASAHLNPKKPIIYVKQDGAWLPRYEVYIKESGSWVRYESLPSGWPATTKVMQKPWYPWTLNKSLQQGEALVDASGWVVSDYIPIAANTEIIVQGMGSTGTNTMFLAYNSDKSYYDYWGGSGTIITTIEGKNVYQKTLSAGNVGPTRYIRITILQSAKSYCKLWQNGKLLFDGSEQPIT